MGLVGILAEYNPLHQGHLYQLAWVKSHYPEDQILVVMSGNVVQRGEFAIVDKWHRAQAAVVGGADLVLELPTLASLQSADYFARHGMSLLARMGCHRLVFGSESARLEDLQAYIEWEAQHQDELDRGIQEGMKRGLAYPAAYEKAILTLADWSWLAPWQANHQLGIQYLKTLTTINAEIDCIVLPRLREQGGQPVASGSAIRKGLSQGEAIQHQIAPALHAVIAEQAMIDWEAYWPYLRYQLLIQSPQDLEQLAGVREGIASRMQDQAQQCHSFAAFTAAMVSKRWTRARIQRLSMAILLQIPQSALEDFNQRPLAALRLLDASVAGRAWLKHWRNRPDLTVFSQFQPDFQSAYAWNLRADQVYELHPTAHIQSQLRPQQGFSFLEE